MEQALPLSHADLALLPSNKWLPSLTSLAPLISLPSALQITPLSSGPVPEALKGFTMAPSHQVGTSRYTSGLQLGRIIAVGATQSPSL